MNKYNTSELLTSLENELNTILIVFNQLQQLDDATLNKQPSVNKWSLAQILEHLNSYNRYYLHHIEAAMKNADKQHVAPAAVFRPGWLGNYFTQSMYSDVVAKNEITNKMKAPKDHTPQTVLNSKAVMAEFAAGEQTLLKMLAAAQQVNICEIKIPISIARWIKINLGDTFRFLIAHQVRHFLQVRNTLAVVKPEKMAVV